MLAIDKLLITDGLFRTSDTRQRRRWVYFYCRMGNKYDLTSCFSFFNRWAALVDEVRNGGGEAYIFSAAHASGEQLGELTGVAAMLRFPLPDLVDAELPPVQF